MKKRLDIALTEQGLVQSREKAKALIMAGQVYVNNQKADKAGDEIAETDKIEIRGDKLKYVSRGGLKLEKAMKVFDLSLQNAICCDFGASTGGFTDCMLQNGASKVYAVDVGYGQLAWALRTDPRVINMERTNIRYITEENIPPEIDFISVDVSFISLKLILPVVFKLLKKTGKCVCLVKPQFEAGRDKVGKKGVVKELSTHLEVVNKIVDFAKEINFKICDLDFSPIKGPEGNIEYLLYLKKQGEDLVDENKINEVVNNSHNQLSLS